LSQAASCYLPKGLPSASSQVWIDRNVKDQPGRRQQQYNDDDASNHGRATKMLLRLTRRYHPAFDDRGFGNDATASSSFAYTVMTVSSLVRPSNSLKLVLEETSLGPDSESLFRVKK